jgi:hypothetical protein|tara:strand:- start:878 stop:1339 length:462 start_codon:yes stop_codon:yes gene_type:complete
MSSPVGELSRFYGLYRGTVVSNKDPLRKRRIKLAVPAVMGQTPTQWAWPVEDAGVKVASPAVGQGVWVMFESGDPSYPIWVGTFGKVVDAKRHVLISPSTSTQENLRFAAFSDSRQELDLVATLIYMGEVLTDYEARISQLEADMPEALNNGL